MKLLIADDEENIRDGLRDNIQWSEMGFEEIYTAENGLEAFEIYQSLKPHVIITDIIMPGMDGLELSREIRKTDRRIPIIILSGYSEFEYAQKALKMEVVSYLLKPVNIRELNKTVIEATEKILRRDIQKKNQQKRLELEKSKFTEDLIRNNNRDDDELKESLIKYYAFSGKFPVVVFLIAMEGSEINYIAIILQWLHKKPHIIHCRENRIIVVFEDPEAKRVRIKKREIKSLFDLLRKNGVVSVTCAGAGAYTEIPRLLDFSEKLLLHRLYRGKGMFLFQENQQKSSTRNYRFTIETLELVEAILRYDSDYAKNTIEKTFSDLIIQKCTNRILVQNICFAYKNLLIQSLNIRRNEIKLLFNLDLSLSSIVPNFITIQEYSEWILSIYGTILSSFSKQNGMKHNSTVYKAIVFMKEHFSESLNVEILSSHIKLSPDYFSRSFKKEIGISFCQYLNRIRIEEAIKLFTETNLLAYEISERVGFHNYKYFVQVFKDIEGYAPSQLRK